MEQSRPKRVKTSATLYEDERWFASARDRGDPYYHSFCKKPDGEIPRSETYIYTVSLSQSKLLPYSIFISRIVDYLRIDVSDTIIVEYTDKDHLVGESLIHKMGLYKMAQIISMLQLRGSLLDQHLKLCFWIRSVGSYEQRLNNRWIFTSRTKRLILCWYEQIQKLSAIREIRTLSLLLITLTILILHLNLSLEDFRPRYLTLASDIAHHINLANTISSYLHLMWSLSSSKRGRLKVACQEEHLESSPYMTGFDEDNCDNMSLKIINKSTCLSLPIGKLRLEEIAEETFKVTRNRSQRSP
ncbi:hypothetical protein Lal_00017072, partial [Lupinus albus]